MKILFWLIVLCDFAGIGLLFLLGLAAAGPSKTNPLSVAAYLLIVPGLLLALSVFLFHFASSPLLRGAGFVLALSPVLALVLMKGYAEAQFKLNSDAQGNMTFFRAGPSREISTAIARNDAAAVAALAPKVNLNGRGFGDQTLLMLAFRQLRKTPDQLGVVRALVKAGADPNVGAGGETPLQQAIQLSSKTGPEPVELLLAAGAKVNEKDGFGRPVWFGATGKTVDVGILQAMLDHGADLQARSAQGQGALFDAATCGNWKATLLLLQRGADWKSFRTLNGQGFVEMLESHARVYGEEPGLAEVRGFVGGR